MVRLHLRIGRAVIGEGVDRAAEKSRAEECLRMMGIRVYGQVIRIEVSRLSVIQCGRWKY